MNEDKKKVKAEPKVSLFDPVLNAYREVSLTLAKKFVESAKEVEKQIKSLEK